MKSAIVTGATGFIGAHLTRTLVEHGWRVHALKRATSNIQSLAGYADSIRFHDIGEPPLEAVLQSINDPVDAVFHLATAYGRDGMAASEMVATNVEFPMRLLEHSIAQEIPLFVATDTCFPISYPYLRSYTLSKTQFAQWGALSVDGSATRMVNLILQHPYGPGDGKGKFVPWLIEACLTKPSVELTSGIQKKDFVYVGDVVSAYLTLADSMTALPQGFCEIECGTGTATSVREFTELVHRLSLSTSKLDFGALAMRPNEVMHSVADVSMLRELGWNPHMDLEDGVLQTIESIKSTQH